MAEQTVKQRAKELRSQIYDLVDAEQRLRRQLGQRVLDGKPVDDLRTRRQELRESQEDLSAAVGQLEAIGL